MAPNGVAYDETNDDIDYSDIEAKYAYPTLLKQQFPSCEVFAILGRADDLTLLG